MKVRLIIGICILLCISCEGSYPIHTGEYGKYYPDMPENLQGRIEGKIVILSWTPSASDVANKMQDKINYQIWRDVNYLQPKTMIGKVNEGQTTFIDQKIKKGRVYRYSVIAYYQGNMSDPSLPIEIRNQ